MTQSPVIIPEPAEAVAWQRRLKKTDETIWSDWRECSYERAQYTKANGHPQGYSQLQAEIRPLYAAPSPWLPDREAVLHILNEMVLGMENFFGVADPKRVGRIRIAADLILSLRATSGVKEGEVLDAVYEKINALGGTGFSTEELAFIHGIEKALDVVDEARTALRATSGEP